MHKLQLQIKMNRLGGKVVEMKKVYKNYGEKDNSVKDLIIL